MNDITTEVEKVVHDNLSEVQMGVFKREMDRLQKIEVEFVQQREEYKALKEVYEELNKQFSSKQTEIAAILAREKDLEGREKEMVEQKTQLHIDNQLIQLNLKNAETRVQDHVNMVDKIFRGPVFRKSVVESNNHNVVLPPPTIDNNGVAQYPSTQMVYDTKDKTTTDTEE